MVDRIVPATTPSDVEQNDAALMVDDAAPVAHEPFAQWVIEDRFAAARPAWDAAGAAFVHHVEAFESMKLRLLNASHSAFAYLGYLAGHEFIYQVAAQPDFVAWMRRFTADEVTPALVAPPGIDLAAYREALVRRFANPALPHRTQQIAMDGSQKLPQRILATVRDNLAANRFVELAALAVAGWMRYVYGEDEHGCAISVSDPLSREFAALASRHHGDPAAFAQALFAMRAVFDEDLHNEPRFTVPVTRWLTNLFADGAAKTVAKAIARQ
jgi:fructuronate reductase